MNQSFYNIAGGIVHKIRREKRTTIPEATFRGNQEILSKINKIGIVFFNFSFESSSFIFNNLKTENLKLTFKG